MDHRGHPKRPIERDSLNLQQLVVNFLDKTKEEDPSLYKVIVDLKPDAQNQLGGILGRFDLKKRADLDPSQRLLARRIVGRLHRHSEDIYVICNKVLDYLDLNGNAILEEDEIELAVKIFEMFAVADSKNDTVSEKELNMMYAVLRHIDKNENGRLDKTEKEQLVTGLKNPTTFLQQQKATNPLLAKVI